MLTNKRFMSHTTSTLLPLKSESINAPAMFTYCMRLIRKLIQHLNPTQIPDTKGIQPVHALMYQV